MRYKKSYYDCIVIYDDRGIIREDEIREISINNLKFNSFELIENEIDIQAIEEIGQYWNIIENTENEKVLFGMMQNNANKIDEVIRTIKQLDNKISNLQSN